jgi:hypothetical protein
MNEQLPGGEVKVQVIRKAVADFVDRLPEGIGLAVVIYGRDREVPSKVEVLRKLGPLDAGVRAQIRGALADMVPSGQAPLAAALKQAGQELAADSAAAGIILITDGPDTCNGDASAQAATLANGTNLSYGVNVIGFGVTPKDFRELRGTAQAGKGRFHDPQTLAELNQTLAEVLADAQSAVERQALLSALAGGRLSGVEVAFGSGPVPAHPLAMLYLVLTILGLLAAAGMLIVARWSPRVVPSLALGTGVTAAIALVILLLQLCLEFPVEKHFHEHLLASRTWWLAVSFVGNLVAVVAALLLCLLERQPARRPRMEVAW